MKTFTAALVFVMMVLLLSNPLQAQIAPSIEWQNTIGGNWDDWAYCIRQTGDSGYIVGGWSMSIISGDKTENNWDLTGNTSDYWVIKLDAFGNIEWQNTIGGDNDDRLNSVQQTTDGGYILGGYSNSNSSGDKTENSKGNYDFWVIKLYADGSIEWQKTIGGDDGDWLHCLQQTHDGGYILGGYSTSDSSGDKNEGDFGGGDYWVVKINNMGDIEWQNTIGGSEGVGNFSATDDLSSIQQTSDNGYILGGASRSDSSADKTQNSFGDFDYWIIKLDSTGLIEWQKTIGGNAEDFLFSIKQAPDKGYIMGGHSYSGISGNKTESNYGSDDGWLVKVDSIGNIQWQHDWGDVQEDQIFEVNITSFGDFIVGGRTNLIPGGYQYGVIRFDPFGNIIWQKIIGGDNDDHLQSIQPTFDNGYILGGRSLSGISDDKTETCFGNYDYWIIKLAADTAIATSENYLNAAEDFFSLSPNPFTTHLQLHYMLTQPGELMVYDALGRKVKSYTLAASQKTFELSVAELPAGVYLVAVNSGGLVWGEVVVKE